MNDVETRRHLLDTVATSIGILAIAVTSAVEVLLFLHDFGTTDRTDGVFAAFALYSLVTVFAQILRTSAVPLVTGDAAPVLPADFVAAVTVMAAVVAVGGFVCATPLAAALGHSLPHEGRDTVASALRILAPAMALQLVGAAMAVIGARREKLRVVGVAYVVANVAGLVAFVVLVDRTGELALPWCVLIGSLVLVPCLLPATGTRVARPGTTRQLARAAALVVRSAAVPVAFVAVYPISIALAGTVPAGEITRFAFAYTVCSYLPGLTSVALGMTDVAQLSATASSSDARGDVAHRSVRWSASLIAPRVAPAAVFGPNLFATLHPGKGEANDLGTLFVELAPWLAATVLLWSTLPALLAETRGVRLVRYLPAIVAVHVVATIAGRAVWGFDGVVIALAIAPLVFAFVSWRLTDVVRRVPSLLWSLLQATAVGGGVYAVAAIVTR